MNKKRLEAILYSSVGVLAMFLILLAANVIATALKTRVDLTADKLYTLSDGTKKILGKMDTKVKVRLYCTQGDNSMPVPLKTYAQRVEDLLNEYRQLSKGNIELEKLDPKPDSAAEDSANLDGVEGQMTQAGEKLYLGLSVSCLDQKFAIPFLSPEREKLLEYDLSRAIARVTRPSKPIVGVMSALPVFGQPMNPMMMRMGQMQGTEPWFFISELKQDFEVKKVEMTADKIDDDIKVLLVIHPRDISDAAQFAIDQFVLRGGKLIAFLDPLSLIDSRNTGGNPMMGGGPPSGSTLDKLLKAWGVEFDKSKVVADANLLTRMRGRNGQPESNPCVLSLNETAINDDPSTFQIDSLLMAFPGAFTGTPAEGLKQTVLLKSTKQSQLVEGFLAQMAAGQVLKDLKPGGTEFALAIRLNGKFKTAFPAGKPGEKDAEEEKKDDAKKDDAKKEEAKKAEPKKDDSLKQSKEENFVILVGDTDMVNEQFSMQAQEMFGQRIMVPFNANLSLAQNFVEQLSGDTSLINARTRATVARPFTRVREMQSKAENDYRAKIQEIEKSLQETQRELNELQRNKDKNQRFVLSPEQQAKLEEFRKKEAQTKKDLKEVRKNLRQDIESLENRIKWANIAGMPLLVTLGGVGLALFKRKRTAAK